MPRPKRSAAVIVSGAPKYEYMGYYIDGQQSEANWVPGYIQCEEEGNHRVVPKTWPPQRPLTDPSMDLRCQLCGANLQVYAGHLDGTVPGIDVVGPAVEAWKKKQAKQPA